MLTSLFRPSLSAVVCMVFLSGCWVPTEVVVKRVVPGVIALPGAQFVAVGEVTGEGGEVTGHLLAQQLIQLGQFSVLDWSAPYAGSVARDGWAQRHGGWRTADATILGTLAPAEVAPLFEARTARAADGQEITTYSRQLQMSITGYFRVLDPQNGMIISSTSVTGQSVAPVEQLTLSGGPTHDEAQLSQLFGPGPTAMLRQIAIEELVAELQSLMACDYVDTSVMLYHDAADANLQRALASAKRGDWHDAREVYGHGVFELEKEAPSEAHIAHYNFGVALAFSGELARGIEEVEMALAMRSNAQMRRTLAQLRGYQAESFGRQGQSQIKR